MSNICAEIEIFKRLNIGFHSLLFNYTPNEHMKMKAVYFTDERLTYVYYVNTIVYILSDVCRALMQNLLLYLASCYTHEMNSKTSYHVKLLTEEFKFRFDFLIFFFLF